MAKPNRIRRGVDLLQRMLDGQPPDKADLEEMVEGKRPVPEDRHLDYKEADWLEEGGPGKLRKWIAGFANAEGGVLALGIREPKRKKAGELQGVPVDVFGGASPQEWVNDALRRLAHYGLAPTVELVELGEGRPSVVLVATPRASRHVYVVSGSRRRYFLRFMDSVQELEGAPLADLVLGERRAPELEVRFDASPTRRPAPGLWALPLQFDIENVGLIPAERARWLAVAPRPEHLAVGLQQRARWSVDLPHSVRRLARPLGDETLVYQTGLLADESLGAFCRARIQLPEFHFSQKLVLEGPLRLDLALVLVPHGFLPQTFVVSLELTRRHVGQVEPPRRQDRPVVFFGHEEERSIRLAELEDA